MSDPIREALADATVHLASAASAYRAHAKRAPHLGKVPADPFFTTRSDDFDRAVERARAALAAQPAPAAEDALPPAGYLPAYELDRLRSGHDAMVRSSKFGPSELDGDVKVYTADQMRAAIAAERAKADALRTVMIAAAEEIAAHWDAHCDAEGYGPANLMHRLEQGIAAEYGYTAGNWARMTAERNALRAEVDTLRADAERYRWLRSTTNWVSDKQGGRIDVAGHPEQMDAAIDAARSGGGK